MTAEKYNNLTPEQRYNADELLKQARFEEFEKYLDRCQTAGKPEEQEEKDVLLQSEEHNPER